MATARTQYRLVQAVPLIPVGIAYGLSYLCPETPRYLVSKQLHQKGLEVLARLRGRDIDDPEITKEFATIDARERERQTDLAYVSHWAIFKETQMNPNYRQRFWLLMTMQTIAQWTGGNGITYYVTSIFQVRQFQQAIISYTRQQTANIYETVRRPRRRLNVPCLLRRIRDSQTNLHNGFHMGSNRPHWSTPLHPRRTKPAAVRTHLHGYIHGPAPRLGRQQSRLQRSRRLGLRLRRRLVYRPMHGALPVRYGDLPNAHPQRQLRD